MRKKADEENFEEAEAQAYRVWTTTNVPSDTQSLLSLPSLSSLTSTSPPFYHLLAALKEFVESQDHGCLPLSSTLPDMKAATGPYIHLQTLYKRQSEAEKAIFKKFIQVPIDDEIVDAFVKNAHALRLLQGDKFGAIDNDPKALGLFTVSLVFDIVLTNSICQWNAGSKPTPKLQPYIWASRRWLHSRQKINRVPLLSLPPRKVSRPRRRHCFLKGQIFRRSGITWEEKCQLSFTSFEWCSFSTRFSERAPTADLPNTAALLGGLVAQEVIKMITKQYVPINGYCAVDLVETWTGIL